MRLADTNSFIYTLNCIFVALLSHLKRDEYCGTGGGGAVQLSVTDSDAAQLGGQGTVGHNHPTLSRASERSNKAPLPFSCKRTTLIIFT